MGDQSRTGAVLFAHVEHVAAFYSAVLGLTEAARDDDHIRLESPGFELVVHRIAGGGAVSSDATPPPARRAAAAFKPVFFVSSLSRLRQIAQTAGGMLAPPEQEWSFNGATVCDALDPEGNLIQFREVRA